MRRVDFTAVVTPGDRNVNEHGIGIPSSNEFERFEGNRLDVKVGQA